MSPTAFRQKGFRFFFFSREEPRMHIHVQSSDGEAKFWLEPDIELAFNYRLKPKVLNTIEKSFGSMSMKSAKPGIGTSPVEVAGISPHGIWILLDDTEHFLPFDNFPWFRTAPVSAVLNVQRPHPHHLHWPDLDVDLHVDSIKNPDAYPLISKPDT